MWICRIATLLMLLTMPELYIQMQNIGRVSINNDMINLNNDNSDDNDSYYNNDNYDDSSDDSKK